MPTVVFVCTANQIRSVLAAAFFQQELEIHQMLSSWNVESAGVWAVAGVPAANGVREYLRKTGLPNVDQHRSQRVSEDLLARADLVIVMESRHRQAIQAEFPMLASKIHLLSECVSEPDYDIPDPGMGQGRTGDVADEIRLMIKNGFGKICKLAGD